VPEQDPSHRAVVTGIGAVTPIGNDHPTFWRNLVAGVSGGGPITSFDATGFDVRIAAEVKDFDPTQAMDRKMARRMSRFIHFAMAAGKEAVADAGLDFSEWEPERRDRVAVTVNTGGGGQEQVTLGEEVLRTRGPGQVSPFAIPALSASMGACHLSMEYGLTGPVITQSAACATSVIAFLDGLRMIQRGEVDVVLAGGSEAPLLPVAFAALGNMGALSKRNDEPQKASRPFDRQRDGFLYGEGAGVVILESAAHAMARGATIQAEVIGASLTADAFHISAPDPTGRGQCMAMLKAMKDAGIAPDEIDYIAAHGTSTPLNDVTETRAIKAAFGEHARKLAISAPKSMVGHMLGSAGVVGAMAAIGAIREGIIPPTINLEEPDLPECDLDYVPLVARRQRVDTAMINGFGFGGQNAVAIFRRFEA
jgi:3-oxoacyl-[acyl-carrier-protein] synthase II